MNRPSAEPWNTRLPAVVSVPPFHGATYSACRITLRGWPSIVISAWIIGWVEV
jgi:hypothetical protein